MSKNKTKKTEKQTKPETVEVQVTSVPFWRAVARNLLPNEKDEWRIGEVALSLQLFAGLLGKTWKEIDAYAEKYDKVRMGIGLSINRKQEAPEVKMNISGCVEAVDESAESVVPDPMQTELPGMEPEEQDEEPEVVYAGKSEEEE